MNKKQFLKGVSKENKAFYEKQIDAQISKDTSIALPYSIFLEGFRVKSHNKLKNRWASTNERKRAVTAFDKAGVQSVSLPKEKRHVEILRLIPPKGRSLDDDNMITGLKWVRDQLTERAYIVDDNRKWAEFKYFERKPKDFESWGVLITIREI